MIYMDHQHINNTSTTQYNTNQCFEVLMNCYHPVGKWEKTFMKFRDQCNRNINRTQIFMIVRI